MKCAGKKGRRDSRFERRGEFLGEEWDRESVDRRGQVGVAALGDSLKNAACILGVRLMMLALWILIDGQAVLRSFVLIKKVVDLVGGGIDQKDKKKRRRCEIGKPRKSHQTSGLSLIHSHIHLYSPRIRRSSWQFHIGRGGGIFSTNGGPILWSYLDEMAF